MAKKYRFEYVKNQIDTQEYISRYTKLKKVGLVYRSVCPFPDHYDKTPSFTVYPAGYNNPKDGPQEHASFSCFGCGSGGDIFEFKKKMEGYKTSFEALKALEEELGIEMEEDEVVQNYMKEQLEKMKTIKEQTLSFAEINLICSSICRNYLVWVKEEYPNSYDSEVSIIDKFYAYFDRSFEEKSAVECMKLIEDVQQKITNRREKIKRGEL